MKIRWRTYTCLLFLAFVNAVACGTAEWKSGVLQGVEVNIAVDPHANYPRQLLQGTPSCGQQFTVNTSKVQSGYYYFGCFREFLPDVPCITFGSRIRSAPGLSLMEGWMTITSLNQWKASKNQIIDWPLYVEPLSATNCTADILGKCDMAGRFAIPDAAKTYYCNVLYATGDGSAAASRTTRVKLGGLDTCDDC